MVRESNRLLVIERANLGAKGSHQLIVYGGGALDETEVRLVVVAGPIVGGVRDIAGLPRRTGCPGPGE